MILKFYNKNIMIEDPQAFGFGGGHGSGVAAMFYFNSVLSSPMLGAEINYQRCFCSWRLLEEMLLNPREDFKEVALLSNFCMDMH
jgi:hypothetical protein